MNANKHGEFVALAVNQGNLIRALRDFFTNSNLTFSTEALQNARRAGASKISIETYKQDDKDCFRIKDDGCGISDWAKLLCVAESGWDEAVMKSDAPYGIGFMSLLFAAEHVMVESNGKMLEFESEHALSMNDIAVVDGKVKKGTVVTLTGLKSALDTKVLGTSLKGFPVPVTVNREMVKRADAASASNGFVETPLGMSRMPTIEQLVSNRRGFDVTYSLKLYLQGMVMHKPYLDGHAQFVVHLDSTKYFGRLPDRECLVDQSKAVADCDAFFKEYYTQQLVATRAAMQDDGNFIEKFHALVTALCPEMFSEFDVIPSALLWKYDGSANISINSDLGQPTAQSASQVTRAQVESGEVELYKIDNPDSSLDSDGYNLAGWVFLSARGDAVMIDYALPEGHWANPFIVDLNGVGGESEEAPQGMAIVHEAVNPGKTARFDGNFVSCKVQLCDNIRMTLKVAGMDDRTVEVVDVPFATDTDGYGGAGIAYVPGTISGSGACSQISDYNSDDQYRENDHDEDEDKLSDVVSRLRLEDPAAILANLIHNEVGFRLKTHDELKGKSFTFTIDADGGFTITQ